MTFNWVYLMDTGKAKISDGSAITSYSLVNSGAEIKLNATSEAMPITKAVEQQPSLSEKDASIFFKEAEVNRNTVENRGFSVSGSLDFTVSGDRAIFANLISAVRSPAVFAFSSDFTLYDENPVNASYNDLDNGNFDENKFVYVIVKGFTPSKESSTSNIVEYTLELVYTQE